MGIKAGVPLTDAFSEATSGTTASGAVHYFASTNRYTIGPMAELRLPIISVEMNLLYKPLNYSSTTAGASSINVNASTWEFPIVGKVHFSNPIVKPYVEGGVSFRAFTGGHAELEAQSNKGFVMGTGIEFKIPFLRIAPELRYTHWGGGGFQGVGTSTLLQVSQNQFEFLVGFSH